MRYLKRVVKKYRRRVERWALFRSQRRDARHVRRLFPALQHYRTLRRRHEAEIRPAYSAYVKEVSTEDMAASLKVSSFLYVLASITRPSRILDLGSGFSSFALRWYAKASGQGAEVISVDDDEAWLMKTRSFLMSQGIDAVNLLHWREFKQSDPGDFDLIFHDLGSMELRAATLPEILILCRPGGLIVLDDMHSEFYRPLALKIVQDAGFRLLSLRKYTLDRFGRFSEIAMRTER